MRRLFTSILAVGLIAVFSARPVVHADLIKLNNGGEVRGKIDRKASRRKTDPVVIKTLSGTVVTLERRHIQFVTRRSLTVEEYETRARKTPKSVAAQWDLADWCRRKGMTRQREKHLREIIGLEPDHLKARRALGYTKTEGKWMTRDERNRARGLVKHGSRYITPEELELIQKTEQERADERKWFPKIRRWRTWVTGRKEKRRVQAAEELTAIRDPDAVVALAHNFRDSSDRRLRKLYLQVLSRIPGPKPVGALVTQSLQDVDAELRYAALNAIAEKYYPAAMPLYVRELRHSSNLIVRRAASGLIRVADKRAIPELINALVTTHRYRIRVPDKSSSTSFGTNGSFGGRQSVLPPQIEAMLRTGQLPNGVIVNRPQASNLVRMKTVVLKYNHQNREVLSALQRLSGQSFGYNKRDWRLWLASTKVGNNAANIP